MLRLTESEQLLKVHALDLGIHLEYSVSGKGIVAVRDAD
jgi:hypothetical protein